ncbi:MAG: hypothetical protein FJ109_19775, partial [Deltaproteobacteria bacterium]|nr:hypothetical protein [Deltaproteobacteria bacterium]
MQTWMYAGTVAILAALAGCGGGTTTSDDTAVPDSSADAQDAAVRLPDVAIDQGGNDGPGADQVLPETTGETAFDFVEDTAGWDLCLTNEDCESGYCVPGPDGKVCTIPCVEECPEGWVCKPVGAQPDSVSICVYPHLELCRPCTAHEDCKPGAWESADYCVPYGPQGSFCGIECGKSAPCPAGYVCEHIEVGEGVFADQCILESGECACTQAFSAAGASTECTVSNDAGTCSGERKCEASGLSDCDAPEPMAESCNGKDDDCDGDADEGTGGDTCVRSNDFGTCTGSYSCVT